MANYTATKAEIEEVKSQILATDNFSVSNRNIQFCRKADGSMFSCDFTKNCKYTGYSNINLFARHIVRFNKTGY